MVLVIMMAWIAGVLFSQLFTASQGLAVTFHNSSEVMSSQNRLLICGPDENLLFLEG